MTRISNEGHAYRKARGGPYRAIRMKICPENQAGTSSCVTKGGDQQKSPVRVGESVMPTPCGPTSWSYISGKQGLCSSLPVGAHMSYNTPSQRTSDRRRGLALTLCASSSNEVPWSAAAASASGTRLLR